MQKLADMMGVVERRKNNRTLTAVVEIYDPKAVGVPSVLGT